MAEEKLGEKFVSLWQKKAFSFLHFSIFPTCLFIFIISALLSSFLHFSSQLSVMRSCGKNRKTPMELSKKGQAMLFRRKRQSLEFDLEEKCEQDQEEETEKTKCITLEQWKRSNENDMEDNVKRECRGRKTEDHGLLVLKKTTKVSRTQEQYRLSSSHCFSTKRSSHWFSCRKVAGSVNRLRW